MKETITFVVTTTGTIVTLFLFKPSNPTQGDRVKMKLDKADGKWKGEMELNSGSFGYSLDIRAGKPSSPWSMAIQRPLKTPLVRTGKLDDDGNGGRVGELTLS